MSVEHRFYFKGGVYQSGALHTCKFLLFVLNGNKELSLYDAKKFGIINEPQVDMNNLPGVASDRTCNFETECAVLKIMISETTFGHEKVVHFFYLALGSGLNRQIVTIRPASAQARGRGFEFVADAKFLRQSEVLALLDPEGISYKIAMRQRTPTIDRLREIISIEKIGKPQDIKIASHGAVRQLRL
jgi:hypothetical protein